MSTCEVSKLRTVACLKIIINFILTGIECIVDKLVTTVNCLVHLCYIVFDDIVIIMDMLMMFKDAVVKCYLVFTITVFLVVKKLMKFLGKVIKHPYFVVGFGIWMMVDIVLDIFSVINYHTLFTQVKNTSELIITLLPPLKNSHLNSSFSP